MVTPVRRARAVARGVQKKLDPQTVTIERPTGTVLGTDIVAVVGETRTDELLQNNHMVVVRIRDYLIDVAEYPAAEPDVGDVIKDADGEFMVTSDQADSAWRWAGRDRTVYRIHTAEINR